MGLFFGTDGIRGKINEDLTYEIAYKIGNALSILTENPTIVIGSDTRISNTYLTLGVASGAMSGGAKVIDVGVLPTAGIAYVTKTIGADYGVVIDDVNAYLCKWCKVARFEGAQRLRRVFRRAICAEKSILEVECNLRYER